MGKTSAHHFLVGVTKIVTEVSREEKTKKPVVLSFREKY